MQDQFRIITMDGKVSRELFQMVRPSDNKNRIVVEDESGGRLTIHKRRVLSPDSKGKAVALGKGSSTKAVCPKCVKVIEVVDAKVTCPEHGEFETISHDQKHQPVNTVTHPRSQPDRSTSPMATSPPTTDAPPVGATVDLTEVKKFGVELWAKEQLNFDHVNMDVRAYVLLAEDPVRKLCFNMYDGSLGKKKQVADLHLEEFKANKPPQGKKHWHLLKGTLDDARQHLEKKGYKKT